MKNLAGVDDTQDVATKDYVDTGLAGKSEVAHTHDTRYYTESEVDALLAGKAATGHTHDDRYYTETEVNTLLSGKSDTGHTHAGTSLADAAPPNPVFGTGSAVGTSPDAAREDHVHALGTPGTPASTTSSSGTVGTSVVPARSDHRHGFSTAVASTQNFGDAASAGGASSLSRSDHKHAMPTNPVSGHEAAADPHTAYALADGTRDFTGAVRLPNGTASAPSLSFANDTDTGLLLTTPYGLGSLDFTVDSNVVASFRNLDLLFHRSIGMNGNIIHNIGAPDTDDDAVNKSYVDTTFYTKTGGTLTGDVVVEKVAPRFQLQELGEAQLNTWRMLLLANDLYIQKDVGGTYSTRWQSSPTANTFSTDHGYIELGPVNTAWGHITTDRPKFYFSKPVTVAGDVERYNEGWSNLSFASGWGNYSGGGGYATAQYRRLPDGTVEVRGLVAGGTGTIGSLPSSYAPPSRLMFASVGNGSFARVDVTTAGGIILSAGTGTSYLSLDPIRFVTF